MPRTRLPHSKHLPSPPARAGPADLGAVARQAVVSFLHDASIATAEREVTRAAGGVTDAQATSATSAGNVVGGGALDAGEAVTTVGHEAPADTDSAAESTAWRAAAVSVEALDRIESAAARVEADIATALRAHAELQAGAGVAVETAVRAAQSARVSAGTAVQARNRALIALRRVEHFVTITVALLICAIIFVVVTATTVH
jgi:hypothetical protein